MRTLSIEFGSKSYLYISSRWPDTDDDTRRYETVTQLPLDRGSK